MDVTAIKRQIDLLANEGDLVEFGSGVPDDIVQSVEMELGGWLPSVSVHHSHWAGVVVWL